MSDTTSEVSAQTPAKERESSFDIAKGLGILFVFGIHCSNNSSRLYVNSRSDPWWTLTLINRICNFAVPLFLLLSAVLYARSLAAKPKVVPFYVKRLTGVLWPYLVWSALYFCFRMAKEPASRKLESTDFLGLNITAPALLLHTKARLMDLLWGKASFHLYFLVVLVGLVILLPPTVAYLRWRKPGFLEVIVTSIAIQGSIYILQHNFVKLQYPASTVFWYVGSLIPGAWIGLNWTSFKANPHRYSALVGALALVSGYVFLKGEIGLIQHIQPENYTANGSQAAYTSFMAILVLSCCVSLAGYVRARQLFEPLGVNSLQIYLIHPIIIVLLEKPVIVKTLNVTYLGPLLSPLLMLAITVAVIAVLRVLRLEKPVFGR